MSLLALTFATQWGIASVAYAAKTIQPLTPEAPIEVSEAPKRIDLMAVDGADRRLLAAHSRAGTLTVQELFVAGMSRTVSVFSLPAGRPMHVIDIGPGRVDQIALDTEAGRLYCPSSGRLVTVQVGSGSDSAIGAITIPEGTHSVAVDSKTHDVWIAYVNADHSYVQAFTPVTETTNPISH
jgi:hypothetical protein